MSDRTNPPTDWELIDVSTTDHDFGTRLPRAITIGLAGTLAIVSPEDTGGEAVTIPQNCLAVGVRHSMTPQKILSAGTSADEIVAWY